MKIDSIAFIGAGRVAAFMLEGFRGAKADVPVTLVDADPAVSARRAAAFPACRDGGSDLSAARDADLVFLALHPPAVVSAAAAVAGSLKSGAVLVSLAPKVSTSALIAAAGTSRVARFLPSAPSAIGAGYNPVSFAPGLPEGERAALRSLLGVLGGISEVDEERIEAYAVLCAMGPTYFWPLLDEVRNLGVEFGLEPEEAVRSVALTVAGTAGLFGLADRDYEALMDMIPAKPLSEAEGRLRATFAEGLRAARRKLTA